MNAFITFGSLSNNTVRYEVDVKAGAFPGFSDWYEEAVYIAEHVAITFTKEGVIVGHCEYHNN